MMVIDMTAWALMMVMTATVRTGDDRAGLDARDGCQA